MDVTFGGADKLARTLSIKLSMEGGESKPASDERMSRLREALMKRMMQQGPKDSQGHQIVRSATEPSPAG